MDTEHQLIYKSRLPYVKMVIAPIVIGTGLYFHNLVQPINIFISLAIMVIFTYSLWCIVAVVAIFNDKIEIQYPFRLFAKRHNYFFPKIKRLIFDNAPGRGMPPTFFIETAEGTKRFPHQFSSKQKRQVTAKLNELGVESYGIPHKSFSGFES